ncbi:hypothetical protein CN479_25575 [Bacillus thuringiensis]|uniref:Uncharacterized protein n=1 Tax=Bacillus cereus TaxID=1396 RepID=A0AAN5XMF9_BACCE|nr:hypothetical protein F8165_24715 [Bacillus cereus]PER36402.1 hypothetical protein CN479_25575 [Bacillus thuringiensis]KAB2487307.1 hypothetical protein F8157_09380 [Bacillus cereus]PET24256.1 hypothetical protein CN517_02425 [Bacillus thuringiensis]PEW72582.1 hypothetical protein CN449_17450 [Bacillus thuringiensis]
MWTAYCFFCLACKIRVLLAVPHAHQAKILRHPHNENFTFLQLFMKILLVFFIFGVLDLKLQQYA